jgi:hypothetical protein
VNGHGNTNGTYYPNGNTNNENSPNAPNNGSINYDKLKQEIIVEFRKELQLIKADIISCKIN